MEKSMKKSKKSDKNDKKAEKQAKQDKVYEKAYEAKKEEFKKSSSDPVGLLDTLLDKPPFKASSLELKQDTFKMVIKTLCKLKTSEIEAAIEKLGEDKAIDLMKYWYKAFEMVHKGEQAVIEILNFAVLLNYINMTSDKYPSIGIARTGFERGDLYE